MYCIAVLSIFSYYDLKYRDVPDRYVWISLFIAMMLFIYSTIYYMSVYKPLNIVYGYIALSLLLSGGLFTVLYLFDMIGEADVLIVFEIALLFPFIDLYDIVLYLVKAPLHLPPILPIVLYSAVFSIVFALVKTIYVSIRYHKLLPRELSLTKQLILLLVGRPMKIKDYLQTKHYYPLTIYTVGEEGIVKSYRFTFNVEEEEYGVHQEKLRKLLDEGLVSSEEYIWVTYGIPYLVPLLAGYLFFLVLGDTPLLLLFGV